MEIRRRGRQPQHGFAMVPNETARDKTLSFRSRGILAFLMSQQEGWRITSETIAAEGSEGRDAVRTALTQLETSGYIRRWRERQSDGTYRGVCDVYPYGDATDLPADEGIDEVIDEPAPENPSEAEPAPENPAQVSQALLRTPSTEDSPSSPDAAGEPETEASVLNSPPVGSAAVVETNSTVTSSIEDGQADADEVSFAGKPFPVAEQRLLASWFKVTDGEPWVAAWIAATSAPSRVFYDPQVHLNAFLVRHREQQRTPRADLWLRWFIEDRQKYAQNLAIDAERASMTEMTPQEREERDNRRMPPAQWGVPTEGGTE